MKKKLFAYVGGGIKSPYFLNNKIYINKNKEKKIDLLKKSLSIEKHSPLEDYAQSFVTENLKLSNLLKVNSISLFFKSTK